MDASVQCSPTIASSAASCTFRERSSSRGTFVKAAACATCSAIRPGRRRTLSRDRRVLQRAGLSPEIDPDIRRTIWLKLVNNVGLNATSVRERLTIKQMLASPDVRAQVRRLMVETLDVGRAMHAIDNADVDARIEYAARLSRRKNLDAARFRTRARDGDRPDTGRSVRVGRALRRAARPRCGKPTRHCDEGRGSRAALAQRPRTFLRSSASRAREQLSDHLPFRYEDLRFGTPPSASDNPAAKRSGRNVVAVKERRARYLEIVEVTMRDDGGDLFTAKWIGRNRYVYGRFHEGMRLFVRGRVERSFTGPSVNVAHYGVLHDGETYRGELVPVYRATKTLQRERSRQSSKRTRATPLRKRRPTRCPRSRGGARLRSIERCVSRGACAGSAGRSGTRARTFVFAEFLALAAGAQLRRSQRERDHDARPFVVDAGLLERFETTLPFAMTGAQRRVIREIWNDLERDVPMNGCCRASRKRQDAGRGGGHSTRERKTVCNRRSWRPRNCWLATRGETRAVAAAVWSGRRSGLRQSERALAPRRLGSLIERRGVGRRRNARAPQ